MIYVYSWGLVCALSIHSGTLVLKSCDHPLSSHQQLLIQSRATAACMVGHINFLLKPAQPSPAKFFFFFFFRCIINCGAHNSVGQVQIIALHVWVTFACNGLGCYQLKDPTDEMGDGEEPRRMRAALESRLRAVPFSFVYVHIHGSGSQQKYTGTRCSASCTFNLLQPFLILSFGLST